MILSQVIGNLLANAGEAIVAAGYHLLQSRRAAGNATARALAAWLLAEAEAFRQTNDPARPAP